MAGEVLPLPPARARRGAAAAGDGALGLGLATLWLSLVVLLPLAAVLVTSVEDGLGAFWSAVVEPEALAALRLSLLAALAVAAANAVAGTLVAWVLVRDDFRGRGVVNALIDLPFALPTIVAGLTLMALYGPDGPAGIDVVGTQWAVVLALLFVTLPFVVRSVQPVLLELDRDVEEAAASLGATGWQTFRRIVLPSLRPAIVSGAGLAFARAIGEFGAVVLIAGNVPFETQVAPVYIFGQVQSDAPVAAAAVSVVLLVLSLGVLLVIRRAGRWR